MLTQTAACSDTVLMMVKAAPKVQAIMESVTWTDRQANRDGRVQLSGCAASEQFNLSLDTTMDESFIFK